MYYIEISLFQLFSAGLISTGSLGTLSFSGLNFNIEQKELPKFSTMSSSRPA
jgi:hypothetical protein